LGHWLRGVGSAMIAYRNRLTFNINQSGFISIKEDQFMINRSLLTVQTGFAFCLLVFAFSFTFGHAQADKSSAASRAESVKVFDDLFGSEVKRVLKTSTKDDDLALAQQMFDAAKSSSGDSPQLGMVILEQVVKLSSRTADGQELAIEALAMLAQLEPEQRKSHQQQALVLLRRVGNDALMEGAARFGQQNLEAKDYAAAGSMFSQAAMMAKMLRLKEAHDVYQAKAEYYNSLSRTQKLIDSLQKHLTARPDDSLVHDRLAWLYTVELDDPSQATRHLEHSTDQELMVNVMLATQQASDLGETQALDMGKWYEKQSKRSELSQAGKAASLRRAKAYYEHYLSKNTEGGLDRTKVELTLKQIDRELESLNLDLVETSVASAEAAEPVGKKTKVSKKVKKGSSKIVNLLEHVNPSRDATSGSWKVVQGQLASSTGYSSQGIRLPTQIKGDYQLEIQFTRVSGTGTVGIQIPVGDNTVSLIFSHMIKKSPQAYMSGLYTIDGRSAVENGTGVKPGMLTNGRRYVVGISVAHSGDQAAIGVTVNGKRFTQWRGKPSSLRPYSYFASSGGHGRVGMASYYSPLVIHSAMARLINGGEEATQTRASGEGGDRVKGDRPDGDRPRLSEAQRREMLRRREEEMKRRKGRFKRPIQKRPEDR